MPLFATLDVERICREIGAAKSHVILAAPGVTGKVAQALVSAGDRLSRGAVRVVLDVSPRVARLGFGEQPAVELLKEKGLDIRHHPGLRLGVLICDEHGWSFAISPRLVEADPTAHSNAFNAIALTAAQVLALRGELPQLDLGRDTESLQTVPETSVVGVANVEEATLEQVRNALKIAPPQQFDLARQTQVYAALIEFVELTFEGFNLQSRRVKIPKSLPLIASQDRNFKDRLSASLKVLDKIEKPADLRRITEALEELRKAYLVPVGQAGRVMLKSKRRDFEKELGKIEEDLAKCKEVLTQDLHVTLQGVITSLTPELVRAVLADPPPRFRGLFPATEQSATEYVTEELSNAFPKAEKLVEDMKIHKFYKDVTYETLKDESFIERVLAMIPKSVISGSLLVEKTAAESGEAR